MDLDDFGKAVSIDWNGIIIKIVIATIGSPCLLSSLHNER
jgi:hypothetical protein